MSEREFNRKILKEKLSEFMYSESFLDKILDLTSESYIEGLKQGMFDRKMLEAENETLKERINKTNNLINTILNLDYDKFCNYDTYINSIIEIKEELSGEKDV